MGLSKISHSDRNKGGKWRSMGDLWTPSIISIAFTGIPEGEERKVQNTKQINKKTTNMSSGKFLRKGTPREGGKAP